MKDEDLSNPDNDYGRLFGRPDVALATLSVWESVADFAHFVHKTVHGRFLNRRATWFEPLDQPSYVIWPIPVGHIPTLAEGKARLMRLRTEGPSAMAFDFDFDADFGHATKNADQTSTRTRARATDDLRSDKGGRSTSA